MVTEQDPFCRQGEDSESLSQHYQDNAVETHPNNDNNGNGAEACPNDAQEDTTDPCANMVTEQDPFCRQGEDSESLNQNILAQEILMHIYRLKVFHERNVRL
uniref:Uncharacterized protein n=1 Tax=Magallana gigas TaxID=29159 RepID=A0A8W8MLR9_MAGGI